MERIRILVGDLLDESTPNKRVEAICAELFELLKALSPATREAVESSTESTPLAAGVALAPSLAASCLLDAERTRAFLRGTRDAIERCVARGGSEVVYAGTGPFAPLALLLVPFVPPSTRLTLLDIHEASTRSVRALSEMLGASTLVREILTVDATKYRHGRPIDLLISETMQRSLAEEPFVEIVRNFRPQLARGAAIVPGRVTLSVVTVDVEREKERWSGATRSDDVEDCGRVFDVTAEREWPAASSPVSLTIDAGERGRRWLGVATDIVVHGQTIVPRYASGLTIPEILWEHSPLEGRRAFAFRYETGARPGLVIERASAAASD